MSMQSTREKALKKKSGLKKVSQSTESCRHCGETTSKHVRYDSGHREYDHERNHPLSCGLKG